jgi:hypothetical protein
MVDCSDLSNANLRLHRWNGIALVVTTLIHVWSILLPCVVHGWGWQIVAGTFDWPLSERKPDGFKDADAAKEMMSLQIDDAFRIAEMTLFLGILMPLSVRWLATNRHVGIHLHRLIATVYFIDIVRRHTHPHSWFVNTPFFLLYIVDRCVWSWGWRENANSCRRFRLGRNYMVVYFTHPHRIERMVGADFHMLLQDASIMEDAHVFTTFERQGKLSFERDNFEWSVGAVIRVFCNKRRPKMSSKEPTSHTLRMYEEPELKLHVYV